MKIQNISPSETFKGIEVHYYLSDDADFMSEKIKPCCAQLDKLNIDYYGDVQCDIQEEKRKTEKGIGVQLVPYDEGFRIPGDTKFIDLFFPYKNFDCKKFYESVKAAIEEMYEFVQSH